MMENSDKILEKSSKKSNLKELIEKKFSLLSTNPAVRMRDCLPVVSLFLVTHDQHIYARSHKQESSGW